jgi:Flp pilus assembly protein TadG
MRHLGPSRWIRRRRSGMTVVIFAILAPVLIGMAGLVIDAGLLMSAYRQAQNGADAAAVAAALDYYRGSGNTALTTANSFVADNSWGVSLSLQALNNPPANGAYAGSTNYVEAIVTASVQTLLIQVLPGVNQINQVSARAVAGWETVGAGEGAVVLNPNTAPGLAVKGQARLIVNGSIVVNSKGSGVDQFGSPVPGSFQQPAVTTPGPNTSPAPIVAVDLQTVGGVDTIDNIRSYDPAFGPTNFYDPNNPDRPVFARAPSAPDPLATLPTPNTSNPNNVYWNYSSSGGWTSSTKPPAYDIQIQNGNTTTVNPGTFKTISVMQGGNASFSPGVYVFTGNGGISIQQGATATFSPGIYIVQGGGISASGNTTSPTVTGNGVMFYTTGGASIGFTGGKVTLYAGSGGNDPLSGMLIYQDRSNGSTISITGNSSQLNLTGTVYAKTAQLKLAGSGKFNAQFIVGSMEISGSATVTINAGGKDWGKANLVFLVE